MLKHKLLLFALTCMAFAQTPAIDICEPTETLDDIYQHYAGEAMTLLEAHIIESLNEQLVLYERIAHKGGFDPIVIGQAVHPSAVFFVMAAEGIVGMCFCKP